MERCYPLGWREHKLFAGAFGLRASWLPGTGGLLLQRDPLSGRDGLV